MVKTESNNMETFAGRVLRDISSPVLVLDINGGIVYANAHAAKLFELSEGYREEDARFPLVTNNKYNDSFNEAVFAALYNKSETAVKRVQYMAPSGRKYVLMMSCSYLPGEKDGEPQLVITLRDDTKVYDSAKVFTAFMMAFCVWVLFYAFWQHSGQPFSIYYMRVEILGFAMLVYILKCTSLTWSDLGIWTSKPGKTVKEALIVSAGLVGFLMLFKGVMRMIDPSAFEPDAPFIDFSRFGVPQVLYILTAGVQEFVARSVMQVNLRRIIVGPHSAVLSIVLSSLIFASLHIHLGFMFMVGAALMAGLIGIMYEKQQNIFGVWIVHWVFGVFGTLLCLIGH